MCPLSFALIGCGSVAAKHVAAIAACPDAKLAAVCDVSPERMDRMAALWRSARGENEDISRFTDYRRLLADPSLDVAVIATISGLHAPIALEALKAGKHVVLEKPIALSLDDADEMIRLATGRGLHVQVCHQLRYRPLMRKIHALVTGGALGNILAASVKLRIYRPPSYYDTSGWRGTWEHDGGMLLNQGIHAVDLLQWFLGSPVRVYGEIFSRSSSKETEDAAAGILTFPGGARAMIEANSVTLLGNLEQSLFLLGDKGVISLGGTDWNRLERWYIEGRPHAEEEAKELLQVRGEERLRMYQALIRSCRGHGDAELIRLPEARNALEIVFALYLSACTGNVQHLPLAGFSTLQMKRK